MEIYWLKLNEGPFMLRIAGDTIDKNNGVLI